MREFSIYRVRIESFDGATVTYVIVTDRGQLKAAAMAGEVHHANGRWPVHEVALEDESPLGRGPGGLASPPADSYIDRMEW